MNYLDFILENGEALVAICCKTECFRRKQR